MKSTLMTKTVLALCVTTVHQMSILAAGVSFAGRPIDGDPIVSVHVSQDTLSFGVTPLNEWLVPQTSVITNDGTTVEDFLFRTGPFRSGSAEWAIGVVSTGADTILAQWSTVGALGPWNDVVAYDSDVTIASGVSVGGSVTLWFRIKTPTSSASYSEYSSNLTVTAQGS